MKINDIINEGSPNVVKASEPKPRKVKPSRGGESEHPYQGRLVGSKQYDEQPVEEAPGDIRRGLAALALAGTLWGAGELTSAKQTPLGQALQQAAAQGDERAAEHLKNLDTYVEANASVLDQLADEYLRNMGEDRSPGKIDAEEDPCWKGYHMVGTKMKDGREVPNCVPGKKGS